MLSRTLVGRQAGRREQRELHAQLRAGAGLDEVVTRLLQEPDGFDQRVRLASKLMTPTTPAQWQTQPSTSTALVFLHIMKVGGVSLTDYLRSCVPDGQTLSHLYIDELLMIPTRVLDQATLVTGHLPFEALELIPEHYQTATMLRDPIARTLSHFKHLKSKEFFTAPLDFPFTLDRFVNDPRFAVPAGNYQARQLAHRIGITGAWHDYSPVERCEALGGGSEQPYPLQSVFDSTPVNLSHDALLDCAGRHLDAIDHVGTTERMAEFSSHLAHEVSTSPSPSSLQQLNVSPPLQEDVTPAVLKQIKANTQVDQALYHRALQRQDEWLGRSPLST